MRENETIETTKRGRTHMTIFYFLLLLLLLTLQFDRHQHRTYQLVHNVPFGQLVELPLHQRVFIELR